jgi:hypothetical protein
VLGLLGLAATVVRFDLNSMLGTWALAAIVILAFILYYGYYAIFEALWNGQTPDKRTIRIRVISTSGRPITVFDALLGISSASSINCRASIPSDWSRSSSPNAINGSAISRQTPSSCTNNRSNATTRPTGASRRTAAARPG